ncbi:MAG: glycoside hydrolase family 99-like domain-containing protein [Phycisphaerae bacterium]|nr:glycoside hydrolase family 99-like domain-containing protein [Phycisphaerae bacterium]
MIRKIRKLLRRLARGPQIFVRACITYRSGGWAGVLSALAHRRQLNRPIAPGEMSLRLTATAKPLSADTAWAYSCQILAQPHRDRHAARPEDSPQVESVAGDPKLMAFYLPQYHPIPENDAWWGRGFTEWTNVTKAVPQFLGHYQPHLPGELGFYDLRLVETQQRQIELARQYGIHGFCYYYYWFNGRKILQTPLENLLAHPEMDFPFCLCWANENWTRRWDGRERDVLLRQSYSADDDIGFIDSIIPALRDRRYLRIHGKAVLLVYRADLLPDAKATAGRWRRRCLQAGAGTLHLVSVQWDGRGSSVADDFDAQVEFPPLRPYAPPVSDQPMIVNPVYAGRLFDYRHFVELSRNYSKSSGPLYRCVMPGWDNEARQPGRGRTFLHSTPELYGRWLQNACRDTYNRFGEDERLVFINAWNEWAEGAYLEPDRLHGCAYLEATARAVVAARAVSGLRVADRSNIAVVVRVTSVATWLLLLERLKHFSHLGQAGRDFALHIMASSKVLGGLRVQAQEKFACCEFTEIGDGEGHIAALIQILPQLLNRQYGYVCVINDAAGGLRDHENSIEHLPEELMGCREAVSAAHQLFEGAEDVGVAVPSCAVRHLAMESASCMPLLNILGLRLGTPLTCSGLRFIEGGMCWFRPVALAPLLRIGLCAEDCGTACGCEGESLARAVEVGLELILRAAGYRIGELSKIG